jgi:hypothetical protein
MGIEIVKVYGDYGVSSAKGGDRRPQFDVMCRDATKRLFDVTSLRGALHMVPLRLAERDAT